jgi:23S rRNA (adenine2503-C2)-methyltransferase
MGAEEDHQQDRIPDDGGVSYAQVMSIGGPTLQGLCDLSFAETQQVLAGAGVRPVHAAALWNVIYRDGSVEQAPAPLQRWLVTQPAPASGQPPVAERTISSDGRTEKFLLRLADGQEIETVIMGYPGRFTACISTQAGCAMGCVFCATGQMGFARHLTAGEIVSQVQHVRRVLASRGERLRNLVLMGMGEPLHNYDHVMKALSIVTDAHGIGLGAARITVNTVGVVPGILRMADEQQPYHLGVSLHGSTEDERAQLVPVSARWPLSTLLDACRTYCATTGRRVFVAWTLIDGVNDSPAHASRLTAVLQGINAHVNLIHLNPTPGFPGSDATDVAAHGFRATVQAAGIPCTIRQLRGIDVDAGCGQLKAERVRRQAMR